jgi:hypothetical protein
VEGEEDGGDEEKDGLGGLEDAGRDGVRVVHLARGLNAGWWHEFQSITEVLLSVIAMTPGRGGDGLTSRAGCYSFLSTQRR